jgi:hypothetical protein
MSDSMRLAGEASGARVGLRASLKTGAAAGVPLLLSGGLVLSGLALGCGPSESSFSEGQAGSTGGYYGQSGTCPGTTGCGPSSGTTGASGTFSGATGTWSGSAGSAGGTAAPGYDGGPAPATDGGVPPMVVEVDPNGTLSATPGLGVGVFAQYVAGGHWLVWWTCDTSVTGQSCLFTISVSPVQGTLSNVDGTQNGMTAAVAGATPSGFAVTSSTSTGRNQVTFDAQPGASVELDAFVEPAPNQNYLFFVQNQRVNGGYQGDLTDPLILEPSSP